MDTVPCSICLSKVKTLREMGQLTRAEPCRHITIAINATKD
jgi:hypothetical protein